MRIDYNEIRFVRVKNPNDAPQLLDLSFRAMILYAQEAEIKLFKTDRSYYLNALNETRGDLIHAMQTEDFLAFIYQGQFIAACRLISDFRHKKTLLTRFSIDPKFQKMAVDEMFLDEVIQYCQDLGLNEIYLYTAQNHQRWMNLFKSKNFQLFSMNTGQPYPKVCLVRDLNLF